MKPNTTDNKTFRNFSTALGLIAALGLTTTAFAGEATSAASAGIGRFGPGTATATAGYNGDGAGIVRTDTRSGNNFSFGRGVSVGIDEDGLTLSASHAVATRHGPAVASNFNLSIGRDGSVSSSRGVSVAQGGDSRNAFAGGSAGNSRGNTVATSTAGGNTIRGGRVNATTHADTTRVTRRRAATPRTMAPRHVYRLRR